MNSNHKEDITILRQYLNKELSKEEVTEKKLSLQELKSLQYKQHLEQLEPIIYGKQE